MAYDKLCEGNRVKTLVGSGQAKAADIDEIQDQLKAILGPQSWSIPMVGGIPDTGWSAASTGTGWEYLEEPGTDPPYWMSTAPTAMRYLNFPIPFARKNFKLTRLFAVVKGTSESGDDYDGYIKIKKNTISAAAGVVSDVLTLSATPWRTAGAWTLLDSGVVAITFDGESDYRLVVASHGDATNRDCRLLGAYATVQLGA